MPKQTDTAPLAAPVGFMEVWEYGSHVTPTAYLTVEVSARGGREAPRRRAVLALASAYGVRARRAKLEEWRTGKNTFYKHEGDHPTQVDLVGDADDVARMAAALPGVLAAFEQTATAHVRTFGNWLRHSAEGQDYADPAHVTGILRRWRNDFVPALASRLALGAVLPAEPVDETAPWTYQPRRVAAAHVEAAGWDLAQWEDPAAAAAILDGAVRRDMSTPAEERLPARVTAAEPEPERESVWEEANRTRAARMQAATDTALAEYEAAQAAERERQDAPEPRRTTCRPETPAHVRRTVDAVRPEADRLRRAWNTPRRPEPVPAPGRVCRQDPAPVLAPGMVTPGMHVELTRDHPWRRTRFAGGRLVSVGPRTCRIQLGDRTHRVPTDELTWDPTTGPVREALDAIEDSDPDRATALVQVARAWTLADHLEHARRGRRPARSHPARVHRPAVEQPALFDAAPPGPGRTPQKAGPLVVIPCSARKGDVAAPARELYTGSYHRMCAAAAEALTARGGRVLILSARHGLISPDTVLSPYEHRMGQLGDVSAEELRAQAAALGAAEEPEVVILAGRAYAEAARAVWPGARTPLAGTRGIGQQRARLAGIIRSSTLPTTREAIPA